MSQKKTSSKSNKLRNFVAPLAAAGLAGVLAFTMIAPADKAERNLIDSSIADVDFSHIDDVFIGADDAPVTIIEYASFTCSHCADFANNTFPKLKKDYIDTGKVRFTMREVITHPAGLWGGLLARCDGASVYYDVAKGIFAGFDSWTKENGGGIKSSFQEIADASGIAPETAEACLNDEETAKALVARYQNLGTADGIKGTPSFIINGKLTRNVPYDELRDVIDAAIEKAR